MLNCLSLDEALDGLKEDRGANGDQKGSVEKSAQDVGSDPAKSESMFPPSVGVAYTFIWIPSLPARGLLAIS